MNTHELTLAGKTYPLKWGPGARYRAEGLEEPVGLADLRGKRATRAAFGIAWAMLPPGSIRAPEDLVALVDEEPGAFERMDTALAGAIANAYPESAQKKTVPDSSPAPASSSASASPAQKSKPSINANGTPSRLKLRERD